MTGDATTPDDPGASRGHRPGLWRAVFIAIVGLALAVLVIGLMATPADPAR